MPKQFPLQTLLDLSHLRLDEATRRLGQLIAGEQEASQRLTLLVEYRDEYRERFLAEAKDGLAQDRWRNYQAFLTKLESAIGQAEQIVAQSRAKTEAGKREWVDKRGDLKTYDTLSERHAAKLRYDEQRQEQKSQDEHAARTHQHPQET
jgi:flagellar FliJ protein